MNKKISSKKILTAFILMLLFMVPNNIFAAKWSKIYERNAQWHFDIWGSPENDIYVAGGCINWTKFELESIILHYDGLGWSKIYSSENSVSLLGIWGSSSTDIFAVGDYGVVLHYDGSTWTEMDSVETTSLLWDVWGTSGSNVFAVGGDGINGTIMHYDGNTWSSMESGTTHFIFGIWGSSGDDIFAVGNYSTILHYDGTTWSEMDIDIKVHLYDVWGSSATDIYAAGGYYYSEDLSSKTIILHYDGTTWSEVYSKKYNNTCSLSARDSCAYEQNGFWGIWGSSSDDVFAVANYGETFDYENEYGSGQDIKYFNTILHYDGETWSETESGTNAWLNSVWGASKNNVYIAGGHPDHPFLRNIILHYTGEKETNSRPIAFFSISPKTGPTSTIFSVDAKACFDLQDSVDDLLVRWDWKNDGTWDVDYSTTKKATCQFSSRGLKKIKLEVQDTGGLTDTIIKRVFVTQECLLDTQCDNNNNACSEGLCENGQCVYTCKAQTKDDPCCDDPACTSDPVCSSWSQLDSGTTKDLVGIWGSSGSDIFAVGSEGTMLHFNGNTWAEMESGRTDSIFDVWGSSSTNVYALTLGSILHYDGQTWNAEDFKTSVSAIWGLSAENVYLMGENESYSPYSGWVAKKNNDIWELLYLYGCTTNCFIDAGWGSDSANLYFVGGGGKIIHYDGEDFSEIDSNITQNLYGIWGSASDDIFAVGKDGVILHYDGNAWSLMESEATDDLYSVWGSSGNDVFAVGSSGTILYYNGSTWSRMNSGVTSDLLDIWGSSGTDYFIVGADGAILHYDGSDMTTTTTTGQEITTTTTTLLITTTTSTNSATTTTSVKPSPCPTEQIFGEYSEEANLLRNFRDGVLSKIPEGQELIQLYYQWSPAIVEAMKEDEELKKEIKEMIGGILPLIRTAVE